MRQRVTGRALSACILAVSALSTVAGGGVARAAIPIQPGALHRTGSAQCTLNFVYDGLGANAGKVYLGTAAHCVGSVGDAVRDADDDVWGRVAVIGNAQFTIQDYALIEVLPADVSRVSAEVKGHSEYPAGVTDMDSAHSGDLVQLSGYGMVFGSHTLTQEQRVAVLTLSDGAQHRVAGPLIFGDSGGPLVHIPTGTALGIVSRLCKLGCTETGPTVNHIVTAATAQGFPIELRTVS